MPQAWPAGWILPALLAFAGPPLEEKSPEPARLASGRMTFQTYCAVCHGTEAKGDGPYADRLKVSPANLTLLSHRNKGTFPRETVRRTIDGRNPVKGHGGPDMPTWGDAVKDVPRGYSEDTVKQKIDELVEFLKSIQAP